LPSGHSLGADHPVDDDIGEGVERGARSGNRLFEVVGGQVEAAQEGQIAENGGDFSVDFDAPQAEGVTAWIRGGVGFFVLSRKTAFKVVVGVVYQV